MSTEFWMACALMLVFEGMLPFLKPEAWRSLVLKLAQSSDAQLRIGGLVAMLLGVGLLYWVH